MSRNPAKINVHWTEVDEARYDEMLCVLPPETMTDLGFLVGEPTCHDRCSVTRDVLPKWGAFAQVGERYFEASEPLTVPEFNSLTSAAVLGATP
jgi:hypothetical protein